MKKCSAKAFATCPDRAVCGSLNEAVYMEGGDCEKFNEAADKQPMTNADRLRAMSDEELGALLCGFRLEGYGECGSCPLEWECDSGRKGNIEAFARGIYQVLQDNAGRLYDLKEA